MCNNNVNGRKETSSIYTWSINREGKDSAAVGLGVAASPFVVVVVCERNKV